MIADQTLPHFTEAGQPRGITARRLSAARSALKRERKRLPLFAQQVASEQETPEQRIVRYDLELLDHDQAHRDLAASHWQWARRQLLRLPSSTRQEILRRWNTSWIPATAGYFADFVRRELKQRDLL